MNIPRFLQLYKEDRLDEAFLSVVLDNPLPASTGRVCQHPCDDRCRREGIDEAVNMFCTDQGFEHVPALEHLQGWLSELMAA